MEKYQDLLLKSQKAFRTADHLTYVTYPLVKDTKIIISVTENIYLATIYAMDSIIEYDILYKRIGPLSSDFEMRFEIFKRKIKERYNLDKETIELIENLRNIIKCHKGSHAEFMKEGKVYIYSSDFKTRSLTVEDLKEFLVKIKKFINKLDLIYKV